MEALASTSYRTDKTCRTYRLWCAAILLGSALAPPVSAQGPTLLLNEVFYDATGTDTGFEWVELFNPGAEAVELSGWRIERAGSRFETAFTFPAGATIAAGGYLVIGESSVQEADLVGSLAFQNGGGATDGIRLVDAAGTAVDVLLYDTPNTNNLADESGNPGAAFAPDAASGNGLARIPNGADTNASAADWQEVASLTPGAENVLPTPTPTPTPRPAPTGVVVNEALPDPVGSDTSGEFIELYNTTGNAVDLTGSSLDDADGGSSSYAISDATTIAAGGYLVFSRSETGIALNNDGDRARLLAEDGSLVHELVFEKSPQEGAAWARQEDGSADWTATPTSGAPNVFTLLASATTDEDASSPTLSPATKGVATNQPSPTPRTVALGEVRGLPLRIRVRTEGVVSVPPGVLGRGMFYVSGSGIQVFVSGGEPPPLAVGDRVSLEGTVSSVRGETRLLVRAAGVRRVGTATSPSPMEVATGAVGEAFEGQLVRVQGTVLRLAGNVFFADDGSGPVRVLVKKSTGWTRARLERRWIVEVVGIASQAGDSYRLLPRFPEDLRVVRRQAATSQRGADAAERHFRTLEEEDTLLPAERRGGEGGELSPQKPPATDPDELPRSPSRPLSHGLPVPAVVAWSLASLLGLVRAFAARS